MLNVNEKTISRWENGETDIKSDKAKMFADFFGGNTALFVRIFRLTQLEALERFVFHEIKAEKEYKVIRIGNENFISENRVLNIIDKYVS